MIAKKNIEPQENSSVKLTLTVEQGAVKKQFDTLLDKYTKSISIKGFRKGKVPASIFIQKFGNNLKSEATAIIVEEALSEALKDEDDLLRPYSPPKWEEETLIDPEKDFTFTVTYDVQPEVKLCEYEGIEIEVPTCSILKGDIDRELESLQERNAQIMEKEGEEKIEEKDIITISYVELDEGGKEIEDSRRENLVFIIGAGNNFYELDEELIGMVKDEEKIIEKSFPENYPIEEFRGTAKKIKIKITGIRNRKFPPLDDELAQDISDEYETLEDLKKGLRKKMTAQAKARIETLKKTSLLDKIVEGSEIALPRSMVQAALEESWQNFVARTRMSERQVINVLEEQNRGKEQVMEELKDGVIKTIKSQLVIDKLIKEKNIQVSPEEWEASIERRAEASGLTIEEANEQLENNSMAEDLRRDLSKGKLFEVLLKKTTIKTGEKVPFLDLFDQNQ